ncbi:MAG: CHC2 zinc finger domain-containing protein [Solirubrobacteraceae bacterium]|jgi:hypothetical protein
MLKPSSTAAELFLDMLFAYAPPRSLLEVRYRTTGRRLARFFTDAHAHNAASTITRIGQRTDVYVGCAPRVRRGGTRQDIAPTPLLWADCDTPAAVAALAAFQPPASMIVTSGSGHDNHKNAHAYWALTRALTARELEDANRRLALALAADPRCADPPRILRVPDTLNFKHQPPRPVRLHQHTGARYRPVEIFTALPPTPSPPPPNRTGLVHLSGAGDDPLGRIAPADYVRILTGRDPGRDHKIHCPLHNDGTPSFHVYPTAAGGWACFGCPTPTGKPLGGDIYKLASLLWGIPTHGRCFLQLRARLDQVFGVDRG